MADNALRSRPPPNRRRDKVQLSCDPCRHRKLRCDRLHPCGACLRRDLSSSCNYATTSTSPPATQRCITPRQTTSLQNRVSELENLVVTLMKSDSLPNLPTPQSPRLNSQSAIDGSPETQRPKNFQVEAASPASPGVLKLRESGTSYVQDVHWEAILNKIRGLKQDLVTDSKPSAGSHLFYGPNRHATRDEILAAVPARPVVDRLMALHFDSYFVTPYLIHSKKFVREYEAFWEDQSIPSIAWVGLMYSMLFIAAHLQICAINDIVDRQAELRRAECSIMKDAFREKAVQCLILARYTLGGPYVLETLITILTGEFILSKDSSTDAWLFISTILHLAIRMGYHRDSDHFPSISPFEGEMRRRVWTTILQLDLSISLELGLPRIATDTHIDTKQPRNLLDSDFDEDTTEMPNPRPETEWTPVLALITRARLITALGSICDINNDINPPSYEEVTKVDALLEDVHSRSIPPVLRWENMPHLITDSPNLVVQRVSVETTYYKARILLYRRALISYSSQQPQERSRKSVRICLDSALKVLSFQQMLHEESQPSGRLHQLRWKIAHIFNQDLLLATSMLCLYLQDIDKFESPLAAGETLWSPRVEEVRKQLTMSHKIWSQRRTTSAEAGKVAKALSIVLGINETPPEDGMMSTSYDFLAYPDAMPPNEFGAAFNSQCEEHAIMLIRANT